MTNLDNLTIHSFRRLQEIDLQSLGQINLFVGVNNSGKSSVGDINILSSLRLPSMAKYRIEKLSHLANPSWKPSSGCFPRIAQSGNSIREKSRSQGMVNLG